MTLAKQLLHKKLYDIDTWAGDGIGIAWINAAQIQFGYRGSSSRLEV